MSKQNDSRKEVNSRSGNNYSRSEFNMAHHAVKSSGGDVNNVGQIQNAANENRAYLNTGNDASTGGGYTGYAYTESDI